MSAGLRAANKWLLSVCLGGDLSAGHKTSWGHDGKAGIKLPEISQLLLTSAVLELNLERTLDCCVEDIVDSLLA